MAPGELNTEPDKDRRIGLENETDYGWRWLTMGPGGPPQLRNDGGNVQAKETTAACCLPGTSSSDGQWLIAMLTDGDA